MEASLHVSPDGVRRLVDAIRIIWPAGQMSALAVTKWTTTDMDISRASPSISTNFARSSLTMSEFFPFSQPLRRERCWIVRLVMTKSSAKRRPLTPTHLNAFPARYPGPRTPDDAIDDVIDDAIECGGRMVEADDLMLPARLRAGATGTARRTEVPSLRFHRAPLFADSRTPFGGCAVVAQPRR